MNFFENIDAKNFREKIKNTSETEFVILDVRTEQEFDSGHIKNAINIDFYSENFAKNLNKLDKNKIYFVYCRSGYRSEITMNQMEKLNFCKIYNLLGGIIMWQMNNFPIV